MGDISAKKIIYILGAIGIILIFLSSFFETEKIEETPQEADYCAQLEERLEKILPKISSVGKVDVMITAENHGEIILAKDFDEKNEETIILNQKGGGEDAKVIKEIYPKIHGVIVTAEGGKSDKVKKDITDAITALLDVQAHKIKVFERTIK